MSVWLTSLEIMIFSVLIVFWSITMLRQNGTSASTQMAPGVLLTSRQCTMKIRKARRRRRKSTIERNSQEYLFCFSHWENLFSLSTCRENVSTPIRCFVKLCLTGRCYTKCEVNKEAQYFATHKEWRRKKPRERSPTPLNSAVRFSHSSVKNSSNRE